MCEEDLRRLENQTVKTIVSLLERELRFYKMWCAVFISILLFQCVVIWGLTL